MISFYEEAKKLEEHVIAIRRKIHQNPEIGFDLKDTIKVIKDELLDIGCEPVEKGGGVWTDIGTGNHPVFLLRADMDALPMPEMNDLPFKSKKENMAHTCGHDIHTSILLGTARILKAHEKDIKGTVRLLFQPNEEGAQGAKSMIEAGVLKNPDVDAAYALHTGCQRETGTILYTIGSSMASSDIFEIDIKGKGGHGAGPQYAIDPINVGVHIHLGLQELIARETPPAELTVLTVGQFMSGQAPNIIPETAVLQGTLRTHSEATREKILRRMKEVTELTAKAYGAEAELVIHSSIPVLFSEEKVVNRIIDIVTEALPQVKTLKLDYKGGGSEDFAEIGNLVPSAYMSIGTGLEKDGFLSAQHNPKVIFDEGCMVNGMAVFSTVAYNWANGLGL